MKALILLSSLLGIASPPKPLAARVVFNPPNSGSLCRCLPATIQADGSTTPACLAAIETAQQDGAWALLDLAIALQASPAAERYFAVFSRTDRRNLLQWLVLARRPETRRHRLAENVTLTAQ